MSIQISKNGTWQEVSQQEFLELVKNRVIRPDTEIIFDGKKAIAATIKGVTFPSDAAVPPPLPNGNAASGVLPPSPPPVLSVPHTEPGASTPPPLSGTPSQAKSFAEKIPWEAMKRNGMRFLRWLLPILKKGGEKAVEAAKKGGELAVEATKKGAEHAVEATKKAAPHVKAQLDKIPVEAMKEQALQQVDKVPGGRRRLTLVAGAVLLVLVGGWWMLGSERKNQSVQMTNSGHPDDVQHVADTNKNGSESSVVKPMPTTSKNSSKKELEDSVFRKIINNESNHYREHGFGDVKLGSDRNDDFPDLEYRNENPVRLFTAEEKCINNSWLRLNEFMFDTNGKLICYIKRYDNSIDEYWDQIIEKFGKPRGGADQWTEKDDRNNIRRTRISYVFKTTCVDVVSHEGKTLLLFPGGGRRVADASFTEIIVFDRAWYEKQLKEAISERIAALAWLSQVIKIAGDANANGINANSIREKLPVFFHGNIRPETTDSSNQISYKIAGDRRPFLSMVFNPRNANWEEGYDILIGFFPNTKKKAIYNQAAPSPLYEEEFEHKCRKIELLLLQSYFQPKRNEVLYRKTQNDDTIPLECEWRTNDGLRVVYCFRSGIDCTIYKESARKL